MAKRVSLKGKGADLFFGGDAPARSDRDPASLPSDPTDGAVVPPPAPVQPGGPGVGNRVVPPQDQVPDPRGEAGGSGLPDRPARSRNVSLGRQSSKAGTSTSREPGTVEAIRKVVKAPGREVSFVRLTADEKARTAEVIHAYKRRGQKTTENEINRIALNCLLLDYDERGEQSLLARVLASVLAS